MLFIFLNLKEYCCFIFLGKICVKYYVIYRYTYMYTVHIVAGGGKFLALSPKNPLDREQVTAAPQRSRHPYRMTESPRLGSVRLTVRRLPLYRLHRIIIIPGIGIIVFRLLLHSWGANNFSSATVFEFSFLSSHHLITVTFYLLSTLSTYLFRWCVRTRVNTHQFRRDHRTPLRKFHP